mgnify:FL=1
MLSVMTVCSATDEKTGAAVCELQMEVVGSWSQT